MGFSARRTPWTLLRGSLILLVLAFSIKVYLVDEPRELTLERNEETTRYRVKFAPAIYLDNMTSTAKAAAADDVKKNETKQDSAKQATVTATTTERTEELGTEPDAEQKLKSTKTGNATADSGTVLEESNKEEVESVKISFDRKSPDKKEDDDNIPIPCNRDLPKDKFCRTFPKLPSLHLLGERHSGTNWMWNHLDECFNGTVDLFRGYSDWKHWYQMKDNRYDASRAVVVAQFRNVYHWTEAMRYKPYHAPLHFNLGWKEFVTKPWTMPRYDEDLVFEGVTKETSPNITCRFARHRKPYEIIPCRANHTFFVTRNETKWRRVPAFYELRDDGSGLPFDSILGLRSSKIRNFLGVGNFSNVKSFHPVRYEDMVHNGTDRLIRNLERELGVVAKCKPIKGEPLKALRPPEPKFLEHIQSHVDWETEALIGYNRHDIM
ncbi:hypothetical protein ACA910_021554 [Epithemia clementina (nom. ined.)]